MGSPNKRVPKSPLKQWVLYQWVCIYRKCCKQLIEKNKKNDIRLNQQTAVQPRLPQDSAKIMITN